MKKGNINPAFIPLAAAYYSNMNPQERERRRRKTKKELREELSERKRVLKSLERLKRQMAKGKRPLIYTVAPDTTGESILSSGGYFLFHPSKETVREKLTEERRNVASLQKKLRKVI